MMTRSYLSVLAPMLAPLFSSLFSPLLTPWLDQSLQSLFRILEHKKTRPGGELGHEYRRVSLR